MEKYPAQSPKNIEVVMNNEQLQEYVRYVKKIIFKNENTKANFYDIDFSTLDKKVKKFFLSATSRIK